MKEFIALEDTYGAHNYHPLDVVIERAEGVPHAALIIPWYQDFTLGPPRYEATADSSPD